MTVAGNAFDREPGKTASSQLTNLAQSAIRTAPSTETSLAKVRTIADLGKLSIPEGWQSDHGHVNTMGIAATDIAGLLALPGHQRRGHGQRCGICPGQAAKLATAGFYLPATSAVDILTTALNAYGLAPTRRPVSDVLLTTQNLAKPAWTLRAFFQHGQSHSAGRSTTSAWKTCPAVWP